MINLLPISYRRQQIVRKRAIQWVSVIIAVVLIGWGWLWFERREEVALAQQLESLEREHAPTMTMLKQLVNMRKKLGKLQHQEAVARELEYHRNVLTLLGVISESAQATKGRIRVTKVQLTGFQKMRVSRPDDAPQGTQIGEVLDGLVVGGVSLDDRAWAEMLDGLRESGMFSLVEPLLLKEREESDISLRDYELRCDF
jgi:hypothetical protein